MERLRCLDPFAEDSDGIAVLLWLKVNRVDVPSTGFGEPAMEVRGDLSEGCRYIRKKDNCK